MKCWRYIDTGPCDAALNMAIDEALAIQVLKGNTPPTLRVYSWDRPSVSIGSFQRLSDVDDGFCEEKGIPVVRRPTGGRAILHGDEITYSFSARKDAHHSFMTLMASYRILSAGFYRAMKERGLDVEIRNRRESGKILRRNPHCFEAVSFGEIVTQGRKVIGSAQKRYREGFLQQGSIPFSIDRVLYQGIFHKHLNGSIEGLSVLSPSIDRADFKGSIRYALERVLDIGFNEDRLTKEENLLAREILEQKYLSPQWKALR